MSDHGRAGELAVGREPPEVSAEEPGRQVRRIAEPGTGEIIHQLGDVAAVGLDAVWAQAALNGNEPEKPVLRGGESRREWGVGGGEWGAG